MKNRKNGKSQKLMDFLEKTESFKANMVWAIKLLRKICNL